MQNPEMKTNKPSLVMPEGIGERIRFIRRASGLTQTQLAEALGVVQQSVSAWERGWTLPGVETLWAFCKETGVSADLVLGLTTDERMGGILAAGTLVHKIFDLVQQEANRISVEAPIVDAVLAAEADLGPSPEPFGGSGAGR